MRRTWLRWVVYLLLALLGAGVGGAGCFVQQHVVYVGGVSLPVGSLIALGGSGGLFFGSAALTESTIGTALPVVVWFGTVLTLAYGGGTDNVVLPNSTGAVLFLFGGSLLAAASVVWVRLTSLRKQLATLDRDAAKRPVTARIPGVGDGGPQSNE